MVVDRRLLASRRSRAGGATNPSRRVDVKSFDGRVESFELANPHWEFAMDLLDALPARRGAIRIVAQWYRAIGAYFARAAQLRRRAQAFRAGAARRA